MSAPQSHWAEPTVASLYAQAVGFFGLGAFFLGLVPALSAALLVPWFFGISIVVFVAAIIDFRNGDMFGATISMITGAVFLTSGTWASLMAKFVGFPLGTPAIGTLTSLPLPVQIEGFFFIPLVIILIITGILALKTSWTVGIMIFLVAAAAFFAPCLWDLMGGPGVPTDPTQGISNPLCMISGILFILFSVVALYVGTAVWIIHTLGKVVLPLGKPWLK